MNSIAMTMISTHSVATRKGHVQSSKQLSKSIEIAKAAMKDTEASLRSQLYMTLKQTQQGYISRDQRQQLLEKGVDPKELDHVQHSQPKLRGGGPCIPWFICGDTTSLGAADADPYDELAAAARKFGGAIFLGTQDHNGQNALTMAPENWDHIADLLPDAKAGLIEDEALKAELNAEETVINDASKKFLEIKAATEGTADAELKKKVSVCEAELATAKAALRQTQKSYEDERVKKAELDSRLTQMQASNRGLGQTIETQRAAMHDASQLLLKEIETQRTLLRKGVQNLKSQVITTLFNAFASFIPIGGTVTQLATSAREGFKNMSTIAAHKNSVKQLTAANHLLQTN